MAGVNIVRVPYKGQGPAVLALLGGEVQVGFASSGSVIGHIRSGKVRALAITTAKPSAITRPSCSTYSLPVISVQAALAKCAFRTARATHAFKSDKVRARCIGSATERIGWRWMACARSPAVNLDAVLPPAHRRSRVGFAAC